MTEPLTSNPKLIEELRYAAGCFDHRETISDYLNRAADEIERLQVSNREAHEEIERLKKLVDAANVPCKAAYIAELHEEIDRLRAALGRIANPEPNVQQWRRLRKLAREALRPADETPAALKPLKQGPYDEIYEEGVKWLDKQ